MKIGPSVISPGALSGSQASAGVQSFRHVLSRKVEAMTSGWRQIVRAEPRYSTAPVLDLPPRPAGVDDVTSASRREEFRSLVASASAGGGEAAAALFRMLEQRLDSEELMLARASQGRR